MRVHASVLIQRPIAVVFAYLSTPDQLPGWVAGLVRADGPPRDELEVGATLIMQRVAAPGHARSTWEVIAYEPPRSLALRGLDGSAGVELHWTLEGVPSGSTRVWVEADLDAVSFFQPASTDLAEIGVRQVQNDLEALRRRLEGGKGGNCS
jgi:uncharacterized protein YndB with AHSA1/START domain